MTARPADYHLWSRERQNAYCSAFAPAPPPPLFVPAYTKGLKVLDGEDLLTAEFPPRSLMLAPWLPDKGLTMIYGTRGVGKTWIELSVAHAVAAGGEYLCWRAPRPRRVLYVDGEMPAATLQERYASTVAASGRDAPRENFRLVAADIQPDGLPDLADPEAQRGTAGTEGDALHCPSGTSLSAVPVGQLPAEAAERIRALACPADFSCTRWQILQNGAARFAEEWGERALALGWTSDELFAFAEPFARVDLQGACWFVGDATVAAPTADAVTLRRASGATLKIYRRP